MFILTSSLRENHQKMYSPPEGKMISDINRVSTEDHNLFKVYLVLGVLAILMINNTQD